MGAQVRAFGPRVKISVAGNKHNRSAAVELGLMNFGADLKAIQPGHFHIQKDEIISLLACEHQGALAIECKVRLAEGLFKSMRYSPSTDGIIIDGQQPNGWIAAKIGSDGAAGKQFEGVDGGSNCPQG